MRKEKRDAQWTVGSNVSVWMKYGAGGGKMKGSADKSYVWNEVEGKPG